MNQIRSFVPKSTHFNRPQFVKLRSQLENSRNITVITGAGCSTESGIPDYRSPGVGVYARQKDYKPILGSELAKDFKKRQRYWARNYIGFPIFASRRPSTVHRFMADWEGGKLKGLKAGQLQHLITQNVDGLHVEAGSRNITELHGCTLRVNCLDCGWQTKRANLQEQFRELNPTFKSKAGYEAAPDADAIIDPAAIKTFKMINCPDCNSDRLKPDVVYFGDNVNKSVVDACYDQVEHSDALLVLGSTLQVYSSYRFAMHAHKHKIPIFIVNVGETRACKKNLTTLHLDCSLTEFCEQFYDTN